MLKRILMVLCVVLLLAALVALLPMRKVSDNEMAWTLQQGDYVWILPVAALKGDVVQLKDPLEPDRTILRRVVAMGEDKLTYEDGVMKVNGKRVRQTDMGKSPVGGRDQMTSL